MKHVTAFVVLLAWFSLPVLAAKNSQDYLLPRDVRVGDQQIAQGPCKVTWTEPAGDRVQLTIKFGGNRTLTLPASVAPATTRNVGVITTEADGVHYLKGFRTKAIVITILDAGALSK